MPELFLGGDFHMANENLSNVIVVSALTKHETKCDSRYTDAGSNEGTVIIEPELIARIP